MGDDEKGYLSEDDEAAVAAEDAEERDEHASDEELFDETAKEGGDVPAADDTSSHVYTLAAPTAADALTLTPAEAEMLHKSQALIDSYQQAINEIKPFGAMSAVQSLENETRKERKRQSNICNEHPAVADAMLRRRDQDGGPRTAATTRCSRVKRQTRFRCIFSQRACRCKGAALKEESPSS